MIGENVGDWRVDAELGRDASGRTYLVHALAEPDRQAVLKILPNTPGIHELLRGRLNLLRKLSHPNLVAFLGAGIVHGDPYYVTDYVNGTDCQTLLRQGKRFSWPEALRMGLEAISALRHAHRRSVLHGDLKPANTIVSPDGSIHLRECGTSRLHASDNRPVKDPLDSGAYQSPEQAAGKPATKRSDFYSLGGLLYAMLTGRPPFTALNQVELIHKQCFVMPERPIHFVPDLPEEFDALIMKLMAKDPAARPGSGTLLLAEFERLWASLESRGKLGKRPQLPPEESLPVSSEKGEVENPLPLLPIPARPPRPLLRRPGRRCASLPARGRTFSAGLSLSRPDPERDWLRAQPLMKSDDPADWELAWTQYLEPLSRSHPELYAEEIRSFRERTEPAAELRKAQLLGKQARHSSEAERFYREGIRLCQNGDFAAARQQWERVVAAFAGIESETRWVELSRQAAVRMPVQAGTMSRPGGRAAIDAALNRVRSLRRDGRPNEAIAVLDALEVLYRDDPDREEILRVIHQEREAR